MSDYLVEDILPKNELSVLAGDPMVGKTRLVLQMLACAQRHERFFDHGVQGPLRVGYVLINMHVNSAKKAAKAVDLDFDQLQVHPVISNRHRAFSIPTAPDPTLLIHEHLEPLAGCDLVVVDPITAYLGRMPNDSKAEQIAEWCRDTNTAVLGLHHPPDWPGKKPIAHPSNRLSKGLKSRCASRMSLAAPEQCGQPWSELTVDTDDNELLRINLEFNDAGRLVQVEDREACLETQ